MKTPSLVLIVMAGLGSSAQAAMIFGVAVEGTTQRLVTWDSSVPSVILSNVPITGLPAGEMIRGIDFDPVYFPGNQRLFAIGAGSGEFTNAYRLNFLTGFASKAPPHGSSPPADAQGQFYGVSSFTGGAIRWVSDANRLGGSSTTFNSGATSGTAQYAAGDINSANTPHLVHLFNDFAVDTALDVLVSFPTGPSQVGTIGSLGANFDDAGAIDAAGENNTDTIYAALLPVGQGQSSFYILNQRTGAATLIGPIGNGLLITAMAVEPPLRPVPEPHAALLATAGLVLYWRHRR